MNLISLREAGDESNFIKGGWRSGSCAIPWSWHYLALFLSLTSIHKVRKQWVILLPGPWLPSSN